MLVKRRPLGSVVLDVDGVLWVGGAPGQGAIAFLDLLAREGFPFCLLTNDCSVSKTNRYTSLAQAGFTLKAEQLITAAEVTSEWLRDSGVRTIMYLGSPGAMLDLSNFLCIRESTPVDAVVVGDLFDHFDRHSVDKAAKAVSDGAILVAMQRNPRWSDGKDWHVDNGFWVAGLEYVTGKQAIVAGKPNRPAYQSALARLVLKADAPCCTAFVSDDIENDLRGAKEVGLTTIHFGPEQTLPHWVDYTARDFDSLISLLIGNDND